jgi:hypothetical protein
VWCVPPPRLSYVDAVPSKEELFDWNNGDSIISSILNEIRERRHTKSQKKTTA